MRNTTATETPGGCDDETPLERLDLGVRAYNTLKRRGISTVGQIFVLTPAELADMRTMSDAATAELRAALVRLGCMPAEGGRGPFPARHASG